MAARTRWLALFLLLGVTPRAALAHAHLRRSEPAAGARVTAPHALRLWFNEEPELSLTVVHLTDSSGADIALGAARHDGADPLSVRLDVQQALAPGRYTVRWSTAAMDGHPSSGSFIFHVLADSARATVAPAPASRAPVRGSAASADTSAHRPSPQDAPYVLVRLLSYAALLVLVGAVVFRTAVLSRVAMSADIEPGLARGAVLASLAFVVLAAIRLAMQGRLMRDDAISVAQVQAELGTHWGGVLVFQVGAAILALIGAEMARRARRTGWAIAALGGVLLALGVAMGGHAVTVERWRVLSVLDDTLHVLAASAWLGSLFWLVAAGVRAPLAEGSSRASRVKSLVEAFSPVALASALVVSLTGLATAWQRLDRPSDLWTTAYGQVLFRKLVLVAIVAAIGAFNWRRVRPALGTDAGSRRLARSAWSELAVGALVLFATAVLVGMPVEGR